MSGCCAQLSSDVELHQVGCRDVCPRVSLWLTCFSSRPSLIGWAFLWRQNTLDRTSQSVFRCDLTHLGDHKLTSGNSCEVRMSL